MKKNRMMRLASILLVCVLLTTSVISGTFAKYTTTASGNDSARVAKWGVDVKVNSAESLFSTQYNTHETTAKKNTSNEDIAITVKADSANGAGDVVAPGTNGVFTFSITGTPEVATSVNVSFGNISMIKLAANTVEVSKETNGEGEEVSVKNQEYYPIKWTLKRSNDAVTSDAGWTDDKIVTIGEGENAVKLENVTLADIEAYFVDTEDDDSGLSGNYDTNTDLAGVFGYYQLSWKWAFNGHDVEDTYLGNEANLQNESFALSITVTQID